MMNLPLEFDDKYYDGMLDLLKEINSKYELSGATSEAEAFEIIDEVEDDEEETKNQAALLVIPLFLDGTDVLNTEFQKQFDGIAEKKSFDDWVIQNIEMIMSIPELHKKNIKNNLEKIIKVFKKKLDPELDQQEEVNKNISELGNMAVNEGIVTSQNKIKFWAVDQTGNLVAKTSMAIFIGNGEEEYIWWDYGDSLVRPSHQYNNGKIFRWDTGDFVGDNPGSASRCRCEAAIVGTDEIRRSQTPK